MSDGAFVWPDGKQFALSLTYDDARPSQLDKGIPILDREGIKATFYVSLPAFEERLDDWKAASACGHEIGNHTMTHPCSGNWGFVRNNGNPLETYTESRMRSELVDANARIAELIGVTPTTFAYPCGHTFIGRGVQTRSYVPLVAEHFLVGRGFRCEGDAHPVYCDLAQLPGREADGRAFSQLRAIVESSREHGGWIVLCMHDVGGHAHQTIHADALAAICRYATDPSNGIWVDTVAAVGQYIRDNRKEP